MTNIDEYRRRFADNEWRAVIFRDMVLAELKDRLGPKTVLDIGCGSGFDDSSKLQQSLIAAADRYVGVDPDTSAAAPENISELHGCTLEDAPVPSDSVDVAFAVMVLEHVREPEQFFDALLRTLKPGGVFLGFTPYRWHYFAVISQLMEDLGLKDPYLDSVGSSTGTRYKNFPTCYRCNTHSSVRRYTGRFAETTQFTLNRPGLHDGYLPTPLRPIGRLADRLVSALGLPGPLLVIRLVK